VAVAPAAPTAASLTALCALGVLTALWSLFLWSELLLSRAGSKPFCPLGDEAACAAVWDSAFASAVHRLSGLPVAAWGLVFGLVALALPLLALRRLAEGHPTPLLVTAIRLTAAAGLVTVFVMLAVSAAEGAFCAGCFATYVLTAGYAGIALFGWQRSGLPELGRAAALAASLTALGWLLLLYPGAKTPRAAAERTREGIEAVTRSGSETAPSADAPPAPGGSAAGAPAAGDPAADQRLREFVASLSPELKQVLSDSLHVYRTGASFPLPPPRSLIGPQDAPVRITEFTDVLCTHCAALHETVKALRAHLPAGSFSVEPRHYPLDGACNPMVQRRADPVRCVAAQAVVCAENEGAEKAYEVSGALFESQNGLAPERALEIASRFVPRAALDACMQSPLTQARLREDIELAARYRPDGTPLVLINGRRAVSVPPFLYAIVLARGRADHPAFASLPAPNPDAHLH
jgi:serine/threonine-protein kinase